MAINAQDITDKARRDLLRILESIRGKKNLVIEKSLAGTIGLFVKFSTLQEYGVDKVFFLENHNVDSSQRNIVFLARGESAKTIRTVAGQIRLVRTESSTDHDFTIIWVPRRTLVSNLVLEGDGVLGEANITELTLNFVPLAQDLLSLELDNSLSDLYLKKDPTSIHASARALMLLQKQYGLFPRILGKGDNAMKLADMLLRMRNEEDVNASSDPNNTYLTAFGLTPSSTIENLIIVDRDIDFPTALSVQLTYEGLIDEQFGIANNQTEVSSSIVGTPASQRQQQQSNGSDQNTTSAPTAATKQKLQLDSTDKLYPDLRDANFATIGPTLNRVARRLQSDQETIKQGEQTISDLQSFVKKLPGYQAEQASLKIHTSLAEEIMKYTRSDLFAKILEVQQNLLAGVDGTSMHENIDELIARRDVPMDIILRLLCLESTLSNGLRLRDLEAFRRAILQAYGYQHLITLANLEKMGLLVPRETHRGYLNPIAGSAGQSSTNWNAVRASLKLWLEDVREQEPDDPAYVFSGYAPLTVRLVQSVLQKSSLQALVNPKAAAAAPLTSGSGFKGFEDTIGRIKGATVDVVQKGRDEDASAARKTLRGNKEGPKTTIVFYLGGVTYAEISALRFVAQQIQEKNGGRGGIVIATTGIVGGNKVVGAAVEAGKFGEE
ncbi:Sec1-like protein [Polychaeton citri CBS 116435]|uniref:Sec1-like protein n=1 Tax=Polychaeton citri CBS 116435 TaxID=1314669 RepID=A0A9P4Q1G4_9PEZI|nr:Sec1-like protein [Polychaeton citri CBS 116435]